MAEDSGGAWARMRLRHVAKSAVGEALLQARVRLLSAAWGDPAVLHEMYTADKLEQRHRLRTHTDVVEQLHRWWMLVQSAVGSAPTITRAQYLDVFSRIAKALLPPSEYDATEVEQSADEDWGRDAAGRREMTRESFMDGMFELADLYVRGPAPPPAPPSPAAKRAALPTPTCSHVRVSLRVRRRGRTGTALPLAAR